LFANRAIFARVFFTINIIFGHVEALYFYMHVARGLFKKRSNLTQFYTIYTSGGQNHFSDKFYV